MVTSNTFSFTTRIETNIGGSATVVAAVVVSMPQPTEEHDRKCQTTGIDPVPTTVASVVASLLCLSIFHMCFTNSVKMNTKYNQNYLGSRPAKSEATASPVKEPYLKQ